MVFKNNSQYFYGFNTLEEFDIAWDNARDCISNPEKTSNELKNKYYKYLFIISDGNQDKFVKFLERKAEENRDTNMLYRCSWSSAMLRVIPLILVIIFIIVLILLPFILAETILEIVFLFVDVAFVAIPVFPLTKAYYDNYYKPFFRNRTPFEYKYNRYLQNKYPILKPENRDENFFDESKKFQEYKKRITSEKKRFELISTKYQVRDGSIVNLKIHPSINDNRETIKNKNELE